MPTSRKMRKDGKVIYIPKSESGKKDSTERNTSFEKAINSELSRGLPESDRKDFYYFDSEYNDYELDYFKKSVTDENEKERIAKNISNGNVLINIDYPKLSGTEKQINYAKNLISKELSREIDSVISRLPKTKEQRRAAKEQFLESAKKMNPSIKTFSDAVNYGLANRRGGVIQFINENKSAAKIIDKYKNKW